MRKYPFHPETFVVRMWFGPYGELHYEQVRSAMKLPKGGGLWFNYSVEHNCLLPSGSSFFIDETWECPWGPFPEAITTSVRRGT